MVDPRASPAHRLPMQVVAVAVAARRIRLPLRREVRAEMVVVALVVLQAEPLAHQEMARAAPMVSAAAVAPADTAFRADRAMEVLVAPESSLFATWCRRRQHPIFLQRMTRAHSTLTTSPLHAR